MKEDFKNIPDGLFFMMSDRIYNELLQSKFNNKDIIKLAQELGRFTCDGYTYINASIKKSKY